MLPQSRGFKAQKFDDLPNHYENDGTECRGYLLENIAVKTSGDESVEKFTKTKLDGTIIYLANPVRQFTSFTHRATNLDEVSGVYMSEEFLSRSELNEGDSVRVKNGNGEIVAKIVSDNKISGDIVVLPTFDSKLNSEALFSSYRFATASIERV
jgi:NADH-quinone oxidoreductase subunit G